MCKFLNAAKELSALLMGGRNDFRYHQHIFAAKLDLCAYTNTHTHPPHATSYSALCFICVILTSIVLVPAADVLAGG